MSLVQIGFTFWAEIQFFLCSVNHSACAGEFDFLLSPFQKAKNWNFSSILSVHQAICWIQLWATTSVFRDCRLSKSDKQNNSETFFIKPGEWWLEKPATSFFLQCHSLKISTPSFVCVIVCLCSVATFLWNSLSQLSCSQKMLSVKAVLFSLCC